MKTSFFTLFAACIATACASTNSAGANAKTGGENAKVAAGVVPLPIGLIVPYAGPTIDAGIQASLETQGWLVCDGHEVEQARYVALYNLIQDRYGHANDPAKFKLPDFTGRTVFGAVDDNLGAARTANSLGASIGSPSLDLADALAHDHIWIGSGGGADLLTGQQFSTQVLAADTRKGMGMEDGHAKPGNHGGYATWGARFTNPTASTISPAVQIHYLIKY